MATTAPGRRRLGIWMAAALVVGNMIGSGIFLLPASLAGYGGISVLGWLFTATGAVLLALVFARLGRAFPRTGGPYAYTRQAVWSLTLVNLFGVHRGGAVQVVTTVLKIVPLIAIAVFGLFFIDTDNVGGFNPSGETA